MAQKSEVGQAQKAAEELLLQARKARNEERYADAKRYSQEAIDLCQRAGVRYTLARALAMRGQIERDERRLDSALGHYNEALKIFREIGVVDRVAHTVRHVGDIQRSAGRLDLAEPCYNEALQIYRGNSQTHPLDLANAIRGLAILKGEMNAAEEARMLWEEAKELYEKVNVAPGVAECAQRIAELGASRN